MNINGKQIQLARESRGISQTELAKRVPNLSQSNLSKMEVNKLPITTETLVNVAEVLGYPMQFFYKPTQQTPMGAFYFRKRMSIPKTSLRIIEAQRDIVRMVVDELLRSVEVKDCNLPHMRVGENLSPSDIARRVRSFFRLPRGPIDNPVQMLEDAGIIVYEIDLMDSSISNGDKMMGFSIYTDCGQPIIFVNKNMPNDRKRFTLMHELGHLVMHIPFDLTDDDKTIEIQADEFSSEFNMPLLDCYEDLKYFKIAKLGSLKSYWKMSKAAIIRRALSIGVINQKQYTYCMIELSRCGERKNESGYVELDNPSLLKQMIDMHLNELNYSKEELCELLGLSRQDFTELFMPIQRLTLRPIF